MPDGVYIASDETSAQQIGFWKPQDEWTEMTADGYDDYKALFVCRQLHLSGCLDQSADDWLSFSPASGATAAACSSIIIVDVDTADMLHYYCKAEFCIYT